MINLLKKVRHNNRLVKIFNALGDANRYKIIKLLRKDPTICVSEVAEKIGISPAGVSQHMKILEEAGLVSPKREGQKICYRIVDTDSTNRTVLRIIK